MENARYERRAPHARILLFLLALAAASAAAQEPLAAPEVGAAAATADRYPSRTIDFPNGVSGIPGAVYGQPEGYRPLTLDLYLPPTSLARPAGGFPLVLYIHGGGWMGGDAHRSGPFVDFPGVLALLASRGYVVASMEYRLSGEARFPAQIQDVKAAVRWLRLHAGKYGIDPTRAVAWGASAGAHLASLAAVSCNVPGLAPAPDAKPDPGGAAAVSDCVQGAVAWYGVFDLATIAAQARQAGALSRDVPEAPEWRLLGCFARECPKKLLAAASPAAYVDSKDPPMLLIVGAADTAVPHQQSLEMAEKLKAAGVEHELVVLPGVDHGLIGKTQAQTEDANLKALGATFQFIDQLTRNTSVARR